MALLIVMQVDGNSIWLKAQTPTLKWGPRDQAFRFGSVGAATQALQKVPLKERTRAQIVPD